MKQILDYKVPIIIIINVPYKLAQWYHGAPYIHELMISHWYLDYSVPGAPTINVIPTYSQQNDSLLRIAISFPEMVASTN